MNKSKIKFYKFYNPKSRFKQIAEILLLLLVTICIYIFIKVVFLSALIQPPTTLSVVGNITLLFMLIIAFFLYFKYTKTLKGVFIYDEYIEIIYAITKRHIFNIKPKIRYSEITECKVIENSAYNFKKYNIPANFICGKGKEFVMLTTYNEQEFFLAVENQKEFVKEINEKLQNLSVQ